MNCEKLAEKHGITTELVYQAFENSVEAVLCRHLSINTVMVNLNNKTVHAVFRLPFDMDHREALIFSDAVLQADPFAVLFDMASFPKSIVNKIGNVFNQTLSDLKDNYDYAMWRARVHSVVSGVILDNYDDHVEISVDNHVAIMTKEKWAPAESQYYRPGRMMQFYVDRVEMDPFKIHLSRSSAKLPALLLKHHLPWHRFSCKKRYTGQKSFVFTDARLDGVFASTRDKVSDELNGEILEVRNFARAA